MIKERLHWLAMHGVLRTLAMWSARQGDPQARLLIDPRVRADPFAFYDELRAQGPLVRARVSYLTVDHAVAHELLRSEDFRVIALGANLPGPLGWLEQRTRPDLLHPLRPPSLLAVEPPEHTRYRKTVSSVFTSRAVAALRDGVERTAEQLLAELSAGEATAEGVVDVVERYCAQLPVEIISEILGVPEVDRPRILEFGGLAAPSLDFGLTWRQYRRVHSGLQGFGDWLVAHLAALRESGWIAADAGGRAAAAEPRSERDARAALPLVAGAGPAGSTPARPSRASSPRPRRRSLLTVAYLHAQFRVSPRSS